MKRIILLMLCTCISVVLNAQVYKTINDATVGTLSTSLTAGELSTVTNLTVTGTIDARDFKTMRDDMPALAVIDISGVSIAAYSGTAGTYSSLFTSDSPINAIPGWSFHSPETGVSKTSLTSVIFPSTVTTIGYYAFRGCTGLTSVNIPSLVTSISWSFYNCTGLTSVIFSATPSLTSIGEFSFYNCTNLTSVTIPSSVTSIGASAFQSSGITSVNFTAPSSLTSIGGWAFKNCTNLTLVTIPSTVTSIGSSAFQNSGLTSVIIANSVTSIGDYAFYDCSGLTSIYADRPTPVDLSSSPDVFNNVNTTTCTLYVPTGSKSLYAVADQWKDFTNIVEHIVTGIATVSSSKLNIRVFGHTVEIDLLEASAPVHVVDISGRQLYNGTPSGSTLSVTLPQAGVYLVRVGNKTAKLVAP